MTASSLLAKPTRARYGRGSRSPRGATVRDDARKLPPTGDHASRLGIPRGQRNDATMISQTAWQASDRAKWGKTAVGPGQHRVLLALWDHAHDWREGEGDWFVWPAIATIAKRIGLTVGAVYRSLAQLRARGWLRPDTNDGCKGWWLFPTPRPASPQLDLFAADASELGASDSEPAWAPPVDNLCTEAPAEVANHRNPTGQPSNENRPTIESLLSIAEQKEHVRTNAREGHDDDAARIWQRYESTRAALPGAAPARETSPPAALRALLASHGTAVVEAYAVRSLELARSAVARGRRSAGDRVLERADGREWSAARLTAVAGWVEPDDGPAPVIGRPPPPPDPVVDGQRVSRFEREAWDAGGAAGVRDLRAAPVLTGERAAAMLAAASWNQRRFAGMGGSHV